MKGKDSGEKYFAWKEMAVGGCEQNEVEGESGRNEGTKR